MGINSKSWGDGQLANTLTTIMQVQSESAVAPRIDLSNTSGAEVTFEVHYRLVDTDRKFVQGTIPANGFALVRLPDLPAGAVVKALASAATTVNYAVTGGSQTC